MGHDEPFIARSTSFPPVDEGGNQKAVVNRMGLTVVVDFFTQMILSGFGYHIQMGTENAGATFTGAIDDQLASLLIDSELGNALIPLLFEVTPGVIAGATLAQAMLELDKDKERENTGGTAFVPENLNGSDANSFTGSAFVAGSSDIVPLAKSAVPASVELARRDFLEDALANTIGYPGVWDGEVYSVNRRPMAVGLDACSLVGHVGSPSADMTGYAVLQVLQLPKSYIVLT